MNEPQSAANSVSRPASASSHGEFTRWHEKLAALHPAYFAMVMATGIVSLGCRLHGLHLFGGALFRINVAAYGVLWLLYMYRAAVFPRRFLADWSSHQRGPGYFTMVAATSVIGVQTFQFTGHAGLAMSCWCLCVILWAVCSYAIFTLLTIRQEKPVLADGINGGWLVAVVATQSVCVLGCSILHLAPISRDLAAFILLSFWLCGGMLYFWIVSLIFYRYMFFRFSPADLMPPYWINMGAMAISTLAGAMLHQAIQGAPEMASLSPFVKGLTLMFWATATWWIPMLVILGFWRHGLMRFRLTYDPLYWGLVFPFGMYSVCTARMEQLFGVSGLLIVSRAFLVLATVAWFLAFLGMAKQWLILLLVRLRTSAAIKTAAAPLVQSSLTGGPRE